MQVKLLDVQAKAPQRASKDAAGYDLYALENGRIRGNLIKQADFPGDFHAACDMVRVRTGIAVALPSGTYGQIASRSSLMEKHGVMAFPGVIDPDYRGEIKVLLYNTSEKDYVFHAGDRIAQLLILPICTPDVQVITTGELTETARGTGGFGSTGV